MISCTSIKSAGGATKYLMEEKNGQQQAVVGAPGISKGVEYYVKEDVKATWAGNGADFFRSTNGAVVGAGAQTKAEDMQRALEGKNILSNGQRQELTSGRVDEQHRPGLDFTFSAPKSVSVLSEVYGNKDVRDAWEQAVNAGIKYLEQSSAQTRISVAGTRQTINTGNLLVIKIEHSLTRSNDSQTHTHAVIANQTYHAESGKWYSLSNEELLRNRVSADAVVMNDLGARLQALGYRLEFNEKGVWEVAGFTKEQLDHFSMRTAAIDQELRRQGIDPEKATFAQREAACLATRAEKTAPENSAGMRAEWQDRARSIGMIEPTRGDAVKATQAEANAAVGKALAHLSERSSAFRMRDVVAQANNFAEGRANWNQINKAINDAISEKQIIQRADGKLTTNAAINSERDMVARIEAGKGQHLAAMTPREFKSALREFEERKGFSLSAEQREAAKVILTGDGAGKNDTNIAVEGKAGTGKTTMLEFIKESFEAKGWEVRGHSNGGAQAEKMEKESGIQSTTTARHLIDAERGVKDAQLAAKAINTFDRSSAKPDFDKLRADALAGKNGVTRAYDKEGRAYYSVGDKTYCEQLYKTSNSLNSANLNHAGLTQTNYYVSDKGDVYKQGGTIDSEAAGKLHEKFNEAMKGEDGKLGAISWVAGNFVFSGSENWQKASMIESAVVKGLISDHDRQMQRDTLDQLKQQAASSADGPRKVVWIGDEAGMNSQVEGARIVAAAQTVGALNIHLGDTTQHGSVNAGNFYEKFQEVAKTVQLTRDSILRQKNEETIALRDKIMDAIDLRKEAVMLEKNGQVAEAQNLRDEASALVSSAMRGIPRHDPNERQNVSMIERASARAAVDQKYAHANLNDPKIRENYRREIAEARKEDGKALVNETARLYTDKTPEQQDKTIIVTSTNADRAAINNAIRETLKERGQIAQQGKTFEMLEKANRTSVEVKNAGSYKVGDIVKVDGDYKRLGVEKGDTIRVTGVDRENKLVIGKNEAGAEVKFDPEKTKIAGVFEAKEKEFSLGDKVRLTVGEQNKDAGKIVNGSIGTVERISGNRLEIALNNGRSIELDATQYRHIDHAYGWTSQGAQGQSETAVIRHANTEAGVTSTTSTYVDITRASHNVTIVTQDAEKLGHLAANDLRKETATENLSRIERTEHKQAAYVEPRIRQADAQQRQAQQRTGQQAQPQQAKGNEQAQQRTSQQQAQPQQRTGQQAQPQQAKGNEQAQQRTSQQQAQPQQRTGQQAQPQQAKGNEQAQQRTSQQAAAARKDDGLGR